LVRIRRTHSGEWFSWIQGIDGAIFPKAAVAFFARRFCCGTSKFANHPDAARSERTVGRRAASALGTIAPSSRRVRYSRRMSALEENGSRSRRSAGPGCGRLVPVNAHPDKEYQSSTLLTNSHSGVERRRNRDIETTLNGSQCLAEDKHPFLFIAVHSGRNGLCRKTLYRQQRSRTHAEFGEWQYYSFDWITSCAAEPKFRRARKKRVDSVKPNGWLSYPGACF